MKTFLDIGNWPRREHFHFFRKFEEPFFGVTVNIDCTAAYESAKTSDLSFFICYLYKTLAAVNAVDAFRYRVSDDKVVVWDRVDASPTIGREDGSFGFALVEFDSDFDTFSKNAIAEIQRVRNTPGLFTRSFDLDNLIHFSALPWLDFTSLSHARRFASADSCPKISFGQLTVSPDGSRLMPMSVHVHHALMDGWHVGQFVEAFQREMNNPLFP